MTATHQGEGSGFLDSLSAAQLSELLPYLEPRSFESGDCIIQQGDVDRTIHIIREGRLDVIIDREDGSPPIAVDELRSGDVVGEVAFFDGLPRTASIVARTDGHVLCLSRESFDRLRHDSPTLAVDLVCDMARVVALHYRLARRQGLGQKASSYRGDAAGPLRSNIR